jgi:hypothetical protein
MKWGCAAPLGQDASLVRIGSHAAYGDTGHPSVPRQMVDDLKEFLGLPVSQPAEKSQLDRAGCHSNRDPHRELFGRDCANCHETAAWRIPHFCTRHRHRKTARSATKPRQVIT